MEKQTILCVDDEENILNSLQRLLNKDDYHVLTAESAAKALEILESNEVHVIISDYRMPEMNGADFLQIAKLRYPESMRIILSGYADINNMISLLNDGSIYRFLVKPWDYTELRNVISEGFQDYQSQQNFSVGLHDQQDIESQNLNKHNDVYDELNNIILTNLPNAVVIIDTEGTVVHMNQSANTMFRDLNPLVIGDNLFHMLPEHIQQPLKVCNSGLNFEANFLCTLFNHKVHVQARSVPERNLVLLSAGLVGPNLEH